MSSGFLILENSLLQTHGISLLEGFRPFVTKIGRALRILLTLMISSTLLSISRSLLPATPPITLISSSGTSRMKSKGAFLTVVTLQRVNRFKILWRNLCFTMALFALKRKHFCVALLPFRKCLWAWQLESPKCILNCKQL